MITISIKGIYDALVYLEGEDKFELEIDLNKEGIYQDITMTKEQFGIYSKYENIVIKGWKDYYNHEILCFISENNFGKTDVVKIYLSKDGKSLMSENQIGVLKGFIRKRKIKDFI